MTAGAVGPFDPADEQACRQAFELNRRAFNSGADVAERWTASLRHSHSVAAWHGDRVVGFARSKPYTQWFGGRPVPMAGVASVTVAAEHRGSGLAAGLVRALLPAMREHGLPVSTLFPTSSAVYRSLGWALAGHHQFTTVRAEHLRAAGRPGPDVSVRRGDPAVDAAAVARCYRELCARSNGLLDRSGPFFPDPAGALAEADEFSVVEADGQVEGYLLAQRAAAGTDLHFTLRVWDLVGLTGRAQRTLCWLVGSHASMVDEVSVRGPAETLHAHVGTPDLPLERDQRWMCRVVDAPAAVAARGWPADVDVSVEVDLVDPDLPDQAGRWRLDVSAGAARLDRSAGGGAPVRLGPGALAALYSAYADPFDLRRAGALDGADRDLERLRTAFAGPRPHLLDYF